MSYRNLSCGFVDPTNTTQGPVQVAATWPLSEPWVDDSPLTWPRHSVWGRKRERLHLLPFLGPGLHLFTHNQGLFSVSTCGVFGVWGKKA